MTSKFTAVKNSAVAARRDGMVDKTRQPIVDVELVYAVFQVTQEHTGTSYQTEIDTVVFQRCKLINGASRGLAIGEAASKICADYRTSHNHVRFLTWSAEGYCLKGGDVEVR